LKKFIAFPGKLGSFGTVILRSVSFEEPIPTRRAGTRCRARSRWVAAPSIPGAEFHWHQM